MLTSPWETVVLWDVTENNDDLMGFKTEKIDGIQLDSTKRHDVLMGFNH